MNDGILPFGISDQNDTESVTEPVCTLQENVVFLKTYKTGSETMAGIFRRFAGMKNLSLVLSDILGISFKIDYFYAT